MYQCGVVRSEAEEKNLPFPEEESFLLHSPIHFLHKK